MKSYMVHFKNNRAFSAAEVDVIANTEIKKIEGTKIEWVIVQAEDDARALTVADDFIDRFIAGIVENTRKQRLAADGEE